MDRRKFLIASTAMLGLSSVSTTGVAEASSDSGLSFDNSGPSRESLPVRGRGADLRHELGEQQTKLQTQQSDTEAVLSGELAGSFSSEVGSIGISLPGQNLNAEILADGSFAATVPTGERLDIAYDQSGGDSKVVTLNGNPDTHYIQYFSDGIQEDTNLGTVEIPEGHIFNIQFIGDNESPLEGIDVAVRSLDPDSDRWWQVYGQTSSDGFYQTPNSPTGIEVSGDVEVAIFADTDDNRVPDVETTERFTVTESRSETITVDPFTATGSLLFADRSAASGQEVVVYIAENDYAIVPTNSDGSFSVDLPPAPDTIVDGSYEIQYYRAELLTDSEVPIDGFVDMYAGPRINPDTNKNIGEITVPDGHLTRARIVDTDGNGVENATVTYTHRNETLGTTAGFTTSTVSDGNTSISGRTGLYLSGPVTISVSPPDDGEYADETIERELIVDEPTTEEITLPSDEPSSPDDPNNIADYTNSEGDIEINGLRKAIDDFTNGEADIETLRAVIEEFTT